MASTSATDNRTLAAKANGASCGAARRASRELSSMRRSRACGGSGAFSLRYWRDSGLSPRRYSSSSSGRCIARLEAPGGGNLRLGQGFFQLGDRIAQAALGGFDPHVGNSRNFFDGQSRLFMQLEGFALLLRQGTQGGERRGLLFDEFGIASGR